MKRSEQLMELIKEKKSKLSDKESELSDIEDEITSLEWKQEELEDEIEDLETDIEAYEEELAILQRWSEDDEDVPGPEIVAPGQISLFEEDES